MEEKFAQYMYIHLWVHYMYIDKSMIFMRRNGDYLNLLQDMFQVQPPSSFLHLYFGVQSILKACILYKCFTFLYNLTCGHNTHTPITWECKHKHR